MKSFNVYLENGQRIELVDSQTLCRFLSIAKPETLIDMAKRGDMPPPIHLNMNLKGKRGRNQIRWNLPAVMQHLGITLN
ncbi:MAG TPA: hypothetical protein VGE29_16240 [Prosthecobacter sp.]